VQRDQTEGVVVVQRGLEKAQGTSYCRLSIYRGGS